MGVNFHFQAKYDKTILSSIITFGLDTYLSSSFDSL